MNQEKEKDLMRWDMDTYEAIATELLEAIPFEYPGSATEVAYITRIHFCLSWTGLPDFGELTISLHSPGEAC